MNRIVLSLAILGGLTGSLFAEERILSEAEIFVLLPKIIAVGKDTRQTFSAAGATTYTDSGRDTYGTWRVQGGKYCSQWPPAGGWSCYGVLLDEDIGRLTWVDGQGTPTINQILPKK